jgi:hypothetical protein
VQCLVERRPGVGCYSILGRRVDAFQCARPLVRARARGLAIVANCGRQLPLTNSNFALQLRRDAVDLIGVDNVEVALSNPFLAGFILRSHLPNGVGIIGPCPLDAVRPISVAIV